MRKPRHTTVTIIVASLLLVAYLLAVYSQWHHVSSDAVAWARRSQLLSALEALAVASAGVLLGTTVQRGATQAAQRDADTQRDRADRAEVGERESIVMRAVIDGKMAGSSEPLAAHGRAAGRYAGRPSGSGSTGSGAGPGEDSDTLKALREVVAAADAVRERESTVPPTQG